MGKLYYSQLRATFGDASSTGFLLEVQDEHEEECPRLVTALLSVFDRKKSLQPLIEYLAHADMVAMR